MGCVGSEQQPELVMGMLSSRSRRPEPGMAKDERCARRDPSAWTPSKTLTWASFELTFPLLFDIGQEALVAGTSSLLECVRARRWPFSSRITGATASTLDVYAVAFSVGAL